MVTMAELLGTQAPASTDGNSFAPTLLGQTDKQKPTEYRYYYWGRNEAIRQGDWKLITQQGKAIELYNLEKDPGETKNLMSEQPEIVEKLMPLLKKAVTPLKNQLILVLVNVN